MIITIQIDMEVDKEDEPKLKEALRPSKLDRYFRQSEVYSADVVEADIEINEE